jgi:hypothetical protein
MRLTDFLVLLAIFIGELLLAFVAVESSFVQFYAFVATQIARLERGDPALSIRTPIIFEF